ncbi:uncharacterized protein SAPINGB_P005849 [Magnusiomyces paraingens]|uniref:Uncharacterized protein n=1 Tax=Magnusiomyces paraingens TaxID=2606893 RepID=A0A5E8C241_9ASCO|nr:uncharacterized protein SAPINGB_P005849 [Saprochaete ingens]VVT57747.1 unnamed protein product [Saprochaete ingens]
MPSDPINANPTVLDLADLPTRLNDDNDDLFSKSNTATVSPLDTFSKDILTAGLWSQYHEQDNVLYSFTEDLSDLSASEDDDDDNTEIDGKDLETSTDNTSQTDPIDAQEIYDLISTINDPEHPLTLGQLAVVNLPHIYVTDTGRRDDMAEVFVEITPTITHCSLATLIGLGIRVRLERALHPRFRILIKVRPGTHQSEKQVNKQLNDKERVAAACENEQLLGVISNMLASCK